MEEYLKSLLTIILHRMVFANSEEEWKRIGELHHELNEGITHYAVTMIEYKKYLAEHKDEDEDNKPKLH